jgi:hypothetical protein
MGCRISGLPDKWVHNAINERTGSGKQCLSIKIMIRYIFKHGKIENKHGIIEKKGYFVCA